MSSPPPGGSPQDIVAAAPPGLVDALGYPYFQSVFDRKSRRMSLGMELDAEFFERMREHYPDVQIVELAGVVAFCLGIGRIYTVLDIANECPLVH